MAKKKVTTDPYAQILKYCSSELSVAKRNQDPIFEEYADYYKMLHCKLDGSNDDLESSIHLPEFTSRVLCLIGDFVARYFSSRDFVDVRMESDDPVDVMEGKASKTLLNKLLSIKDMYYYHKVVRLLMFVFVCGYGIVKGGYKQATQEVQTGEEPIDEYAKDDAGNILAEDGSPFTDEMSQVPLKQTAFRPITETQVLDDRPDFDVFPINDVYFSSEYAYSLREKKWVIFRTYQTIDELESNSEMCGYFNLDKLRKLESEEEKPERDDQKEGTEPIPGSPTKTYKVYERWGKHYVMDNGDPGLDKDGKKKEGAQLKECIISWVTTGKGDLPELLIRFQLSPFSRRPVTRFSCYIDAYEDRGFGDGEPVYQLQVAIDDTFNLSNLRTQLATTPSFKGRKFQSIPKKVNVSPREVTFLENMDDLQELVISDNIQGSMVQMGNLSNGIDTVMSVSPIRMGVSGDRKETATVGALTNQNANIRAGLRSTTLEFAGFTELYDMLLSLTNDFMLPETLTNLIGEELAMAYNPQREDRFIPVSQALENEDSKQFKMSMIDQLLGRVVSIPNPKTPMVVNYLLGMWLDIAGGNFKHFKKFMFEEDPQMNALYQSVTGGKMGGAMPNPGSTPNANMMPAQNQTGLPQPQAEQQTRQAAAPFGQ